MRQYRGKRLDNGEWFVGDSITEKNADGTIKRAFIHVRLSPIEFTENSLTSKIILHEVDPKTVGQYTGLKDKNGVEIYEGDILTMDNKVFFEILYDNGSFRVKGRSEAILNMDRAQRFEVIGNIHDPELLGEGQANV